MSERPKVAYWSDLYAGDADELLPAWRKGALDGKRSGLVAHFNMPYIMSGPEGSYPESIDAITAITYVTTKAKRTDFEKNQRKHLDRTTGSLAWMSHDWMALFAGLDDKQITMVGRHWADLCDRFGKKKPWIDTVRGIVRVCKAAKKAKADVVYTFTSAAD
jgi:hypothetical protein